MVYDNPYGNKLDFNFHINKTGKLMLEYNPESMLYDFYINGNGELIIATDQQEIDSFRINENRELVFADFSENSLHGDLICDLFDEENNVMNPPSDAGWFFYNLIGKSLDKVSEIHNQSILNRSPVRCEDSYLDLLAQNMGLKRDLNWSNDEFRAYLILHYYNTRTKAGLEYALNQIAIIDASELTGYITVSYSEPWFKYSDRFVDHELASDRFEDNDLIDQETTNVVRIEIPPGVNIDLMVFISQFLGFDVEVIKYD